MSSIGSSVTLPMLVIGLTVATTSLLYYWFNSRNNRKFVTVCKVNKLLIYPVKALKGIEVNHLQITDNVVKYGQFRDRLVKTQIYCFFTMDIIFNRIRVRNSNDSKTT